MVVLGAGLCGLMAGAELGDRAVVVERASRPGGLARTEEWDGYWFDHVLHLLHFADSEMELRVRDLLGDVLEPCPPDARIDCAAGTVRYPFQLHLGGLQPDVAATCLQDFVAARSADASCPSDYEEWLLHAFGQAMCEQFFFPYNRKLWRRSLRELAPTGFQWNMALPSVERVARGVDNPDVEVMAYNSNGWYPRPPTGAPLRGMEVLSRALAARVDDLRLQTTVEFLDLDRRTVTVIDRAGYRSEIRYRDACLSTLPLPVVVNRCRQTPARLRSACRHLYSNRVRTVALSIQGPRPADTGLWHYYTDESIIFTRLVHLAGFDPHLAPPDGWGLLAEVPERGDVAPVPPPELIDRTLGDVTRLGVLSAECRVVDTHVIDADPAYVVFTPDNAEIMSRARSFLSDRGVTPLGRYGRWEYSSMSQVMEDGLRWAQQLGTSIENSVTR